MVRMQVQLTEAQVAALKKLSVSRGVSIAELIRQGTDLVIGVQGVPDPKSRRDRALTALGCFKSGSQDLAEHHDKHFAEASAE